MKLGPSKLFNYLITLIIVGLAVWATVSLYSRYIGNPWTRDGQVRANIVGIAPRVSGPIIQVAVRDNQPVRKVKRGRPVLIERRRSSSELSVRCL